MVDYSKWKNIEISDDEDDTHPNIDTPSLFRWRHQARLDRMKEQDAKKEQLQKERLKYDKELADVKSKLSSINIEEKQQAEKNLQNLEKKQKELKEKEAEIAKDEKLQPWNVDTISKEGFSKTMINDTGRSKKEENLSEEERAELLRKFVKANEDKIKAYGMLGKYDDSMKFMMENPHLACDSTANYLLIWCINLEMEGKHELMDHIAHQVICVQFILELAKQLDRDPRSCIAPFFHRIQKAEPEYKRAFTDELEAFKSRVRKRAAEKLDEALKEIEIEEREKRLGPGGLDPIEVMESLPQELKDCFESQNIELLKETIAKMDQKEAAYHMKRCVDSGLWVPEANKQENEEEKEQEKNE